MALNIRSGTVPRAQKVVLYGVEGIGKTTLASQAPGVLFIDTEGGTSHMDVRRIEKPESWEALIAAIQEVAATPDVCRTLAIDTADWAEVMAIDHICQKYRQTGLESFGYGKGYTYLSEEFARLLAACDAVIASGKHVIITAHAKMRKQELPDEMGAFDRWELKLSRQCAPMLKEWADAVLFLNYKTIVVTSENNTKKGQGGKRVIYTAHAPTYDAKNRHGLKPELDLKWDSIAPIFGAAPAPAKPAKPTEATKPRAQKPAMQAVTPETLEALHKRIEADTVTEDALKQLVADKGHFPADRPVEQYPEAFVTGWILPNWEQIVNTLISDPKYLPF